MRWQHFDELEADFQQYYNLDISQVKPVRAARLLFQLPKKSRTLCILQPANQWGWDEVLANKSNYLLEILAWQKTKDGQKKRRQPKPFTPEFMKVEEPKSPINKDSETRDVDDIRDILSRPRV